MHLSPFFQCNHGRIVGAHSSIKEFATIESNRGKEERRCRRGTRATPYGLSASFPGIQRPEITLWSGGVVRGPAVASEQIVLLEALCFTFRECDNHPMHKSACINKQETKVTYVLV